MIPGQDQYMLNVSVLGILQNEPITYCQIKNEKMKKEVMQSMQKKITCPPQIPM